MPKKKPPKGHRKMASLLARPAARPAKGSEIMIDESTVRVIEGFLREGIPHRRIAALTHVSRGTVANVVRGKVRPGSTGRQAVVQRSPWGGPVAWCSACRAHVTITPCLACAARKWIGLNSPGRRRDLQSAGRPRPSGRA